MKNIVLVGFMGTGKTVIAKRISRKLKMKYVSTDDIVEAREEKSISEIFSQEGEAHFRSAEREAVREAASIDNVVIAAGGGVVLNDENMRNLRATGVIICLNAAAEDIFERTKSYANRPLLNVPDSLGKIKELMKIREPYYKKADHQVDTSGKSVEEVTDEIIAIAEKS